jgi:6,7-dimethyl-8-ribityllumazine synthase
LLNSSITNLKPIGNAVLSCINQTQAIARTKGSKNRAAEAVNAIISVLNNV